MCRCPAYQEFHKIYITEYCNKYHLNHCFKLIEEFAKEHKGTLDGELAFGLRAFWHIIMGEYEEALIILQRNENSEYDLSRIWTYTYLTRYYGGWFNPSIDLQKREEYYQKHQKLYPKLVLTNEWEKAMFKSLRLFEDYQKETDRKKKIEYIPRLRHLMQQVPEYGKAWNLWFENNFANAFYALGEFEEARKSFELTIKFYKNSDTSIGGYRGLILLAIVRGNLVEAEEYLEKSLDLSEKGKNRLIKTLTLNSKAQIEELQFNLDEAEITRLYIVALNEFHRNELHTFTAIYNLFEYYFRAYSFTGNHEYHEKAIATQKKLEKFVANHPNNVTMIRLAKLSKAEICKLGGIKDRAKSMMLFEELLEVYPGSLEIRMNLVELYFEDLDSDPSGDTQRIIDTYLDEIQKSPLMKNPSTISQYSRYQILVAKYIYFLKGDIDKALHILYDVKDRAVKFGLKPVEENISKEIRVLEAEIQKWNNVDLTTKERIEKSNIQSYFKSALNIIGISTSEERN